MYKIIKVNIFRSRFVLLGCFPSVGLTELFKHLLRIIIIIIIIIIIGHFKPYSSRNIIHIT